MNNRWNAPLTTIALTLLIQHTSNAQPADQHGLISYWNFDVLENDTFYDQTAMKSHGTSLGGRLVEGIRGKALYFDGNEAYALIGGKSLEPHQAYSELGQGSISVWFRVDHIPDLDGISPIFYYGNREPCNFFDAANEGLIIEVGHSPIHMFSKRVYFTIWRNGCTYPSFCFDSSYPIIEGWWYHLVVVVGEDYNTGYLNGFEMISRKYNFGNDSYSEFFEDAPNPERMWLGKGHWDRSEQYLEGAIDELRIYNRPLSFGEVASLYADTVSLISSEEEISAGEEMVRVYPNPAGEFIHYELNQPQDVFYRLELLDLNGRLLKSDDLTGNAGRISTSGISPGLYYLQFRGKNGIHRKSVLVAP